MATITLFDRVLGMFAGVAIGDALGMPVETMKAGDIAKLNGGRGVFDYMEPQQTRIGDTKNLKKGDTSDDWQLTRTVARSLVEAGGFDLHHQADSHLNELAISTFGWGESTMRGLEEIRSHLRTVNEEPFSQGDKNGCGNGVIMKISPIVAYGVLRDVSVAENILSLGRLTHPDMRARIAAVMVAGILKRALLGKQTTKGDIDVHATVVRIAEARFIHNPMLQHFVTNHVVQTDATSVESLIKTAGVGFAAYETAAFTLGVYCRHREDFASAVLEAVNAGGDTDTNASVVGALLGATVGYSGIPDYLKSIPVMLEVRELATRFFRIFT